MRNFFMKIPRDLVDAAVIDGASPFRILVNVVLPLSMPVIATISLFYAVYHWNEWFYASIYISENTFTFYLNGCRKVLIHSAL